MSVETAVGPHGDGAPAPPSPVESGRRPERCWPGPRADGPSRRLPAATASSDSPAGRYSRGCGTSILTRRSPDGIQVDGEWCVAGSRPSGPRQTRSSWRTWPQRKRGWRLHRTVEHRHVPPDASASSMQSPPASAEAIRVIILSPAFARPGASQVEEYARAGPGWPEGAAVPR